MDDQITDLTPYISQAISMTVVLNVLEAHGPQSGYSLLKIIEEMSNSRIRLKAGTLYPQIENFFQDGYLNRDIEIIVSKSTNRERRVAVFSLSEKGRNELKRLNKEWKDLIKTINSIIGGDDVVTR